MNLLRIEFWKCRRLKIYLAPLLLLAIQFAWAAEHVRRMTPDELAQGWADILYAFPLLNAMLMPTIVAVLASRLADVEHKGQTFKLLETLESAGRLFDAKVICASLYVLLMLALQLGIIVIIGSVKGFTGPLPWDKLGLYALSTVMVTLSILLVQLILSLLITNQMIGMILGLIGSFVGLFSLFLPPSFQKFFIWAYYGLLYVAKMDWDAQTRITDFSFVPYDWLSLGCITLFCLITYCLGRQLFIRKEV